MPAPQDQYDEAMFAFSQGDYDGCITRLRKLLAADPQHFDAQLALGMAYFRKGDCATAIGEGQKAQTLRPDDPLGHTNLSIFYMKAGDKSTAEHHGLQARLASWKGNLSPPTSDTATGNELSMAQSKAAPVKLPPKFPDMPWKKKPPVGGGPVNS